MFVFALEAELAAIDQEPIGAHRCGYKPDPALRRRPIGVSWALNVGGMQWHILGWLSGILFTTLQSAFARWISTFSTGCSGPRRRRRVQATQAQCDAGVQDAT